MKAHETFQSVWDGSQQTITGAWRLTWSRLFLYGHHEEARIARIQLIKSIPIQLSNRAMISSSGKLLITNSNTQEL